MLHRTYTAATMQDIPESDHLATDHLATDHHAASGADQAGDHSTAPVLY